MLTSSGKETNFVLRKRKRMLPTLLGSFLFRVHAVVCMCTPFPCTHCSVRARTHTLLPFISSCFLSLHLLTAAFQNRDEKNRMKEDELQFSFINTKKPNAYLKKIIFLFLLSLSKYLDNK